LQTQAVLLLSATSSLREKFQAWISDAEIGSGAALLSILPSLKRLLSRINQKQTGMTGQKL
jgi:hypothetical protein